MEIETGIHLVNGIKGANCYLVITESEIIVIDTGMPGNGRRITDYVTGIGKKLSDISYVVLTHADIDHIGSAAEIKKLTGAKLAIHINEAPILAGKSGFKSIRGPLGILFKALTPLMRFHAVEPDVILNDGDHIDGFKVIYTPGHTSGSICLYQPGKTIFVGDALRCDSKGNPKPPSKNLSVDIIQAKASINAIAELEFDSLLPGHGAPVMGKASAKLKNLIIHLNRNN